MNDLAKAVSNECWYIQKGRADLNSEVNQKELIVKANAVLRAARAVIRSDRDFFLFNSNFRMNYGEFPQLEKYEKQNGAINPNTIIAYATYGSSKGLIREDDKKTLDQMMKLTDMTVLE